MKEKKDDVLNHLEELKCRPVKFVSLLERDRMKWDGSEWLRLEWFFECLKELEKKKISAVIVENPLQEHKDVVLWSDVKKYIGVVKE